MSDAWGDPDPDRVWRPPPERPLAPDGWPEPVAPPTSDVYVEHPYAVPDAWAFEPPPEPVGPRLRAEGTTLAVTTAFVVLLGAPAAFLWRALAPTVGILRTAAGPAPTAPESSQLFRVDQAYVVAVLVAGVVSALVAFPWLRRRGPSGAVGLALGGLLAALVTAGVGKHIVVDHYLWSYCHVRGCRVYSGTLLLQARTAAMLWPAAALVVHALLTALVRDD